MNWEKTFAAWLYNPDWTASSLLRNLTVTDIHFSLATLIWSLYKKYLINTEGITVHTTLYYMGRSRRCFCRPMAFRLLRVCRYLMMLAENCPYALVSVTSYRFIFIFVVTLSLKVHLILCSPFLRSVCRQIPCREKTTIAAWSWLRADQQVTSADARCAYLSHAAYCCYSVPWLCLNTWCNTVHVNQCARS